MQQRWRRLHGVIGIVLTLLTASAGLIATSPPTAAASGTYSAPEWFPLRYSGDAEVKVGCTYQSYGAQGGYECNGYHPWWALDLMANVGSPVHAAGAGQVVGIRTGNTGCSSTSNYVQIKHGDVSYTYYTHLESVRVSLYQWVDPTTLIGTVGRTGLAAAKCSAHLHYERRSGTTQSTAVDPGPLKACYGSTLKTFPQEWRVSSWGGIAWGTRYLHSDGTTCSGGVAPPPPDADTDGVPDVEDACPMVAGIREERGCQPPDGVSGDFTGDGRADVMAMYDYGSGRAGLWIFPGTDARGDGSTAPYRVWYEGRTGYWSQPLTKLTAGDFTGDGRADVMAMYDYGSGRAGLWIFPGTDARGDGSTAPYRVWYEGRTGYWSHAATKIA